MAAPGLIAGSWADWPPQGERGASPGFAQEAAQQESREWVCDEITQCRAGRRAELEFLKPDSAAVTEHTCARARCGAGEGGEGEAPEMSKTRQPSCVRVSHGTWGPPWICPLVPHAVSPLSHGLVSRSLFLTRSLRAQGHCLGVSHCLPRRASNWGRGGVPPPGLYPPSLCYQNQLPQPRS